MTRDIEEMRDRLGGVDAILISGDIAYAGKREEFEDAAQWLDDLCKAAGCGTEAVFMCPGNHDVDQSVIRDNPLIQDGHDAIRRGLSLFERDRALTQRLVQPAARALFYSPIAAYNEFAARYQSSFFADSNTFVWEHDFILNDGSTLRLRGLNTALLSGLADHERGLFLGERAWTLPLHSGVEYMIMAHHPISWLADGREAERAPGRARAARGEPAEGRPAGRRPHRARDRDRDPAVAVSRAVRGARHASRPGRSGSGDPRPQRP